MADVFAGAEGRARFGYLLEGEGGKGKEGPTLHVYCFSKAADPERDALDVRVCGFRVIRIGSKHRSHPIPLTGYYHHQQRAGAALGLKGRRLEKAGDTAGQEGEGGRAKGVRIHHVRDVAPKKPMFCLSFPLSLAWEE